MEILELRKRFMDDGVVILPGLIASDLIAQFQNQIEATLTSSDFCDPQNLRCRFTVEPIKGASILDAIDPITDVSTEARSIANHAPLLGAIANVYGEAPHLFKDKYILRRDGAPGYPPHQDFIAWPFFPKTFLTALIAIDPISKQNGCLTFYKGSHKQGLLTPADGDFHNIAFADLENYERVSFPMQPGDVLLFDGFVVHESETNHSQSPRRSLYLSYNATSDGGDQRSAHYRYFHSWLKRRFSEYGEDRLYFA